MKSLSFRKDLVGVQDELLRFAYKLTTDREEANDLLQETSLKALDNEDKYTPDTNFKGWMYTIMRNIFINNYRKVVRDQTFVDQTDNLYHLNLPQDGSSESTERAYDLKEMHRVVNALPKEYRVPFAMHVSGFNQNVLVGDSLLSISIDKYLGEEYPLYQDFFYDFQRRLMTPEHIVPDYLAGWLMSEYPFEGKENVLLDRMIYEGKIKYLIHQAFPELKPEVLMGYTETSYNWCKENESNLWKAIIERKHLYTPDLMTTNKYFDNVPSIFLASDAPGNLGSWLGWQIIDKYMRETNSTPEALMQNNDSQAILTDSKYKP